MSGGIQPIPEIEIEEGQNVTLLRQVLLADRSTYLTQSIVNSITLKVFDEGAEVPTTAISTDTLTLGSTIFDTLQTDARWEKDSTGYNFRHFLDGSSLFTKGGGLYRIEVVIATSSTEDGNIPMIWLVKTRGIYST